MSDHGDMDIYLEYQDDYSVDHGGYVQVVRAFA